jgi:hypothetical protein
MTPCQPAVMNFKSTQRRTSHHHYRSPASSAMHLSSLDPSPFLPVHRIALPHAIVMITFNSHGTSFRPASSFRPPPASSLLIVAATAASPITDHHDHQPSPTDTTNCCSDLSQAASSSARYCSGAYASNTALYFPSYPPATSASIRLPRPQPFPTAATNQPQLLPTPRCQPRCSDLI